MFDLDYVSAKVRQSTASLLLGAMALGTAGAAYISLGGRSPFGSGGSRVTATAGSINGTCDIGNADPFAHKEHPVRNDLFPLIKAAVSNRETAGRTDVDYICQLLPDPGRDGGYIFGQTSENTVYNPAARDTLKTILMLAKMDPAEVHDIMDRLTPRDTPDPTTQLRYTKLTDTQVNDINNAIFAPGGKGPQLIQTLVEQQLETLTNYVLQCVEAAQHNPNGAGIFAPANMNTQEAKQAMGAIAALTNQNGDFTTLMDRLKTTQEPINLNTIEKILHDDVYPYGDFQHLQWAISKAATDTVLPGEITNPALYVLPSSPFASPYSTLVPAEARVTAFRLLPAEETNGAGRQASTNLAETGGVQRTSHHTGNVR